MMKNLLLTIFTFLFFGTFAVYSQCTPDPQYADSAATIRPDTLNFPPACQGRAFNAVITIKTTVDTTVLFSGTLVAFWVKSFKIISMTGLPAGFTYAEDDTLWANTGTIPNQQPILGCVAIAAPQASVDALAVGTYPIAILADAEVQGKNPPFNTIVGWASALAAPGLAVRGYKIVVKAASDTACAVGILEYTPDLFEVFTNFPNPFTKITQIKYNSPKVQNVTFKVYDIVGKVIEDKNVFSERGLNIIIFNGEKIASGVYFYSLSDGSKTIVKRMVIQ